MERVERFYKIISRLKALRPGQTVRVKELVDMLEVSRYTILRDIDYLIDRFGAPIEHGNPNRGYRLTEGSEKFELPGVWISPAEAAAIATLCHLLASTQPELLGKSIKVLLPRLEKLAGKDQSFIKQLNQRMCILKLGHRPVEPRYFEWISYAVLMRKRLDMDYQSRTKNEKTHREISPQRLIYYRDNWYLSAFDHTKNELRTFSLEKIDKLQVLKTQALDVDESAVTQELEAGFGIFSGPIKHKALLRFTPFRARWVATECWHLQQKGWYEDSGAYCLQIPYSEDKELLMDILKYGPEVEVLKPKKLRQRVKTLYQEALKIYEIKNSERLHPLQQRCDITEIE